MPHLILRPLLAAARDFDVGIAAGTQVLLTNGHELDMAFPRSNFVDHHGFAWHRPSRSCPIVVEKFCGPLSAKSVVY